MRHLVLVSAVVAGVALPSAAFQTRSESALLAELRQNQEQLARVTALVGQLSDRVSAIDQRVGDSEGATVKVLADQRTVISQLSGTVQTMREDSALRATQTTQDIVAVREGVRLLTDKVNQLIMRSQSAPGADPSATSAAVGTVQMPPSPEALMDPAMADIIAGHYDLAIDGFKEVIEKYPGSPAAAKAQFYVGEAWKRLGRAKEAIAAYETTIANYKDSEFAREAMFMKGVTLLDDLKNPAQARAAWEALIKQFPNSAQAVRAQERLKGMKGGPSLL